MERWSRSIQARVEKEDRVCLPFIGKIYAPTKCSEGGHPVGDCTWAVNALVKDIRRIAGGATVTDGVGHWIDDKGKPVVEPVKVIEFAHCLDKRKADEIGKAIVEYAVSSGQESISVSDSTFTITPRPVMEEWYLEKSRKWR